VSVSGGRSIVAKTRLKADGLTLAAPDEVR
jgi:hypothetical protein